MEKKSEWNEWSNKTNHACVNESSKSQDMNKVLVQKHQGKNRSQSYHCLQC
jgi:hypothetical protein